MSLTNENNTYLESFTSTLNQLPAHKQVIAKELIEELQFMRELLNDAQHAVKAEGLVNIFQNGNQTNSRETPESKAYMNLTNRYKQYLQQLGNLYPVENTIQQEESELEAFIRAGEQM